ncbi:hypothetical protein O181_115039 [Austropuccinia psidii MF-1]|uniref:Uncharacterized protein n=1 Tax=Austropuccinia psidii MF-1 TaxID=1389203 RepID=A0A9Q3K6C5_9BASI|nr:hypothetical protein [Austropuccinia psidii MF-1]
MPTPSPPLFIGMINICTQINCDITLNPDNSHLASWIILWQNQHKMFLYLPNHQNSIGSLPGTPSNMLIPFLGAPKPFKGCGPGGAWIENVQSNATQTLFVEGVFITDQNDPSSSQKPNLVLMFFTWYLNILFIIESFRKQDFKLQIPNKYDRHSHRQCQSFTHTTPTSISTTPSYPAVFSLSSKQKLIQLPSGSDLPMMTPPHSIIHQGKSRFNCWRLASCCTACVTSRLHQDNVNCHMCHMRMSLKAQTHFHTTRNVWVITPYGATQQFGMLILVYEKTSTPPLYHAYSHA